ncbi:MAG: hypothetical protein RLZZ401_2281, partial [Pseudomonadota bacterium]
MVNSLLNIATALPAALPYRLPRQPWRARRPASRATASTVCQFRPFSIAAGVGVSTAVFIGIVARIESRRMDAWLDLRIAAKWLAAPDVVVLDLVTPERTALPRFEAGAYIDVQIPASPCGTTAGLVRPYSLCNAPHESQIYRIAVQRGRHSRGASAYLHGHTQVGGLLRVQHPRNEFPLCRSAVYTCLLAGGIGVAPLLAMAEDAWHRGAAFALHYSARTARLAAF